MFYALYLEDGAGAKLPVKLWDHLIPEIQPLNRFEDTLSMNWQPVTRQIAFGDATIIVLNVRTGGIYYYADQWTP